MPGALRRNSESLAGREGGQWNNRECAGIWPGPGVPTGGCQGQVVCLAGSVSVPSEHGNGRVLRYTPALSTAGDLGPVP